MKTLISLVSAFVLGATSTAALADPVGPFGETVLATSATDPDLINPWGVSFSATSPFWVSDNGTGKATLYNGLGVKQGLVVSMPAGSEAITGQVFNNSPSFHNDTFLFASENGTITGWRGALGTTAELVASVVGGNFKGLALSTDKTSLYGADFGNGTIDVFGTFLFGEVQLVGTFSDPTAPAGYKPFNVQNIGGTLYVTFALASGGDDVAGAGHGFVKTFDPVTHTFGNLVSQGVLDSPWGLALAPAGFGALAGDLLVGNFGDGRINAFNATTGALVGTLADASLTPLVVDGLWSLSFGNGGTGFNASSLYVTAGPDDEAGGVFARIDSLSVAAVPEPSELALMAAGLGLLTTYRLRRRRA